MKTIIQNSTNCSKYLFADDKQVVIKDTHIEIGDPANLDVIIADMNSSNATLIEGVTEPEDWFGCKYNYVNDAWELCEGWVDPRLKEDLPVAPE
jgi:hypothetical protein